MTASLAPAARPRSLNDRDEHGTGFAVEVGDGHARDEHTVPGAIGERHERDEHRADAVRRQQPLLGGDAADVRYPYYLVNGRVRTAPRTFTARPGQRARIRIINAAADTAFRVALGGHTLTVTHTDGYPVNPVQAGALLIGMGERYDVQVSLGDGVFPLVALAEGKNSTALALVRTAAGSAPPATIRPAELVLAYQA